MVPFRLLIAALYAVLLVYTLVVIGKDGMGLLPIFFGDIAAVRWPGQFNLDFLCFLVLNATWLAWRHHFTPLGLALGILGFFGGFGVLGIYLIWASVRAKGDPAVLLLGPKRAAARRGAA
ncbi:MAG: hypothetical protein AAGD40_07260 [Pseudomonadota bacterium]